MKHPKIGVIGLGGQSAFLSTDYLPVPGQTVSCTGLFFELGGKGYNQAIACARMGVDTVFVGAVGNDAHGDACAAELEAEGITACLVRKPVPTAFATITTAKNAENTVAVFPGAAKALTPEDLRAPHVMDALKQCSCLLLQNELARPCLEEACRIGKELGIPVYLNPAPAVGLSWDILKKCQLITPNYGEALLLAGISPEEKPDGQTLARIFRKKGITRAVITLGAQGALLMEEESIQMIPSFSFEVSVDTTGAGDTFNGYLVGGLVSGMGLYEAACLATVAAGISVTRHGAVGSIPFMAEVDANYQKAKQFF